MTGHPQIIQGLDKNLLSPGSTVTGQTVTDVVRSVSGRKEICRSIELQCGLDGLGAMVEPRRGVGLYIKAVRSGGLLDTNCVHEGDVIKRINGRAADGMDLRSLSLLIKECKGAMTVEVQQPVLEVDMSFDDF